MTRSDGFSWFTYLTFYLHALILFLLFCWRVDGLVLNKASHEEYRVVALSLILLLFILGTIPALKRMEKRSQRRMVIVNEEARVKCYLKFGFGAALFFSFLPRIAVFMVLNDYLSIWVYILVSLGGISIFFFIFIFPYRAWFHVFYHVCGSATYVPLAFNFLLTTGLCRIGSTFPEEHHAQILFVQLFFTWISVVASVELAHIITTHVYVQKPESYSDFLASLGEVAMIQRELVISVKSIEYDDEKFNCKICTQAYDLESQIPLMLKSCGHSLCTVCVNTLLSENRKQYIICPFCQVVTSVQGPAWYLPKNYTILEFLEAMPKDVDVEEHKGEEEEAVDVEEAGEAVGTVDAEEAEDAGEEQNLVQQVLLR